MDFSLKGRTALVTGGSRGIGRAIVLALAQQGVSVTACYTQEGDAVTSLAAELNALGADAYLVRADITAETDVDHLLDAVRERFGSLDILVNNASVIGHYPLHEVDLTEWRRVIDTNLTGLHLVYRASYDLLSSNASIINIGSAGALRGIADRVPYMTSKAALVGHARSLCKELGPRGIRINVIAPGYTDTDRTIDMSPERRASIAARSALGRLGTPEEVA
ncbi:SDR family NAD(P)-dependent oxidoreductase, partial [Frankia sp. Cr1]|uniref:SDR family NAD(P)-dependent oxidoreductase n=1 Tax=Frankia sp. Cr1 TaxID=3073931 RepID=UPI002AD4F66E